MLSAIAIVALIAMQLFKKELKKNKVMFKQGLYLVFCVLGFVLPMSQFIPWVYTNGLDIPLLIQHAFETPISAFAWLDVLVSAFVVLAFIVWEGKRIQMKRLWISIIGLVTVGVSFGLPFFLLQRERHLSEVKAVA